jgi:DnaA family protein
MEQLPLGVRLRTASTFESFQPGDNAALLAALEARAAQPGLAPLWVWGAAGSGRSHALQASCARASARGRRPGYLPLAADWMAPALMAGLEALDLVCLDDVDAVAGRAEWQAPLFALYNDLAERRGNLVMSAACPPQGLAVPLPDLGSRFAAALVWQLKPLDDAAQAAALLARAAALGMGLGEEVLQYLTRRLPRDLGVLCEALDRLDAAALAQQRRLTVPFVRAVLGLAGE